MPRHRTIWTCLLAALVLCPLTLGAAELWQKKFMLMHELLRRDHLAVNVGLVASREVGMAGRMGWKGPDEALFKQVEQMYPQPAAPQPAAAEPTAAQPGAKP